MYPDSSYRHSIRQFLTLPQCLQICSLFDLVSFPRVRHKPAGCIAFTADLTGTMNALEVIKKYGTHYMETAKLSGLRICSATLDVRNTIDITKLRTAMKTKVLSLFLDVCSHDRI